MNPFEKIISGIKNYISTKKHSKIIALYFFGSYASGKETPLSDVDMADLTSCLGIERVDIVILNEATPELAYNVLKNGQSLYERHDTREQVVSFTARTYDRYFDYLPVKKMFSNALLSRIREGRYGV